MQNAFQRTMSNPSPPLAHTDLHLALHAWHHFQAAMVFTFRSLISESLFWLILFLVCLPYGCARTYQKAVARQSPLELPLTAGPFPSSGADNLALLRGSLRNQWFALQVFKQLFLQTALRPQVPHPHPTAGRKASRGCSTRNALLEGKSRLRSGRAYGPLVPKCFAPPWPPSSTTLWNYRGWCLF